MADVLVEGEVAALRRELHAVAARLAVLEAIEERRRSRLTRQDRRVMAALWPVIGGSFGPELFQAVHLVESDDVNLRLAIDGRSVKRLAHLLVRAEGVVVRAGDRAYTLESRGTGRKGVKQWAMMAVVSA